MQNKPIFTSQKEPRKKLSVFGISLNDSDTSYDLYECLEIAAQNGSEKREQDLKNKSNEASKGKTGFLDQNKELPKTKANTTSKGNKQVIKMSLKALGGSTYKSNTDSEAKEEPDAANSKTEEETQEKQNEGDQQNEEDALDAYMKEIEGEEMKYRQEDQDYIKSLKGRIDVEAENEELEAMNRDDANYLLDLKRKNIEYDENGNIIERPNKHNIENLDTIEKDLKFQSYRKIYYKESEAVAHQTAEELQAWMQENDIQVEGSRYLNPLITFDDLSASIPPPVMNVIQQQGYVTPTLVQKQCLPYVLSGFSVIGISPTGSGKTFTYLWPMITHVLDQPALQPGDGPIALILVPTRELAEQVQMEAKKYLQPYDVKVSCLVGGVSKWQQSKSLHNRQPEVCIAVPGRLCDHIKDKNIRMNRVTFLVLDEADRMLSIGFEGQLRSIVNQLRHDRQTVFFSATFPPKLQSFAFDMMNNDKLQVRVRIGREGASAQEIEQRVIILDNYAAKWIWLSSKLNYFNSLGKVLIFVSSQNECEEVAKKCSLLLNENVGCIHGEKHAMERDSVMRAYKKEENGLNVLVATDIAARGLDVQGIQTVINYTVAKNIDLHIHRIGRTGRMRKDGVKEGVAYTLVTKNDKGFAIKFVQHLQASNQPIPEALLKMAEEAQYKGDTNDYSGKRQRNESLKSMIHTAISKRGLDYNSTVPMTLTSESLSGHFQVNQDISKEIKEIQKNARTRSTFPSQPPLLTHVVPFSKETAVSSEISTTQPPELSSSSGVVIDFDSDFDPQKLAQLSQQMANSATAAPPCSSSSRNHHSHRSRSRSYDRYHAHDSNHHRHHRY